jgi:hypothetical protein
MTKPKMVRCEGSGQIVFGMDEPDGTVFCSRPGCSETRLSMVTTTLPNGEKQLSVPEHERRANPLQVKSARRTPRPKGRRNSRRDGGRRR